MVNKLDTIARGEQLKLNGIDKAVDHANQEFENWSDLAFIFLSKFIKTNKVFMTEEVRKASIDFIPEPPSNRAWGGIVVRAKNAGLIKHNGYSQVKNPKAHRANASVWAVK